MYNQPKSSQANKMSASAQREKEWHNRRFEDGGDKRANSKVRFAYSACVHAQRAFSEMQNTTNKRILDIGCGRGIERARQFTSRGCVYTGVDISEECISANTSDCAEMKLNALFLCDDANTLSSLNGHEYDLIIISGTLHHLELEKAVPTLARLAAKDGRVIMWEPMGTNPVLILFRLLTPSLRTADEHPLNFSDLKAIQSYFPHCKFQFHTLTALLTIPIAMSPSRRLQRIARAISLNLGMLDEKLGKIPIIRRLHWIVIVSAEH